MPLRQTKPRDRCCLTAFTLHSGSRRRLAILGSTGSIGVNTLDVVDRLHDHFEVVGLAAHSNWRDLFAQARACAARVVVLTDTDAAQQADRALLPPGTELLTGRDGVEKLARHTDVDMVVSAIVGAAGLHGTWSALDAGKSVALANKESLVVAGSLVTELARRRGCSLLPVDSEHSAIFQALHGEDRSHVRRIVLTASGGPFRGRSRDELESVTLADALKHPTWNMGTRITIDSATLMNKALEVIEAHWLFDVDADRIGVIVHPESMIHSFVEYVDGSVLAQLSPPDMRLPIQYALTYPERHDGPAAKLDWTSLSGLNFEQPDRETFPALDLGFEAVRRGGTCGAVLNAAKEGAVDLFLDGQIGFLQITQICSDVLYHHHHVAQPTLEELMAADQWARQEVTRWTHPRRQIPTTT